MSCIVGCADEEKLIGFFSSLLMNLFMNLDHSEKKDEIVELKKKL